LKDLAAKNEGYAVISRFFNDLHQTHGDNAYINLCRARMPHLADALMRVSHGALKESTIVQGMAASHELDDGDIVKLSAVALDLVTRTVAQAIDA